MNDFADQLLRWFDQHGRKDLPWQQAVTPYRVWVSEIMLQQTQVATVIPYYNRFMARFPSIDLLAEASQDEVLHLWTGLGYYARARNLHQSAQTVMTDFNGELPGTQEELESLPGIGRSTAGAIISICTNRRAAILDGNVKRVLARVFAIDGWPGKSETLKALWQKAEDLTPNERVADYTQAIMDLGAMVCTRSSPNCKDCPFADTCIARMDNRIKELPSSKPKKTIPIRTARMLVLLKGESILLEQRPAKGLWGGLWSFPEAEDINGFLEDHQLTLNHQETLAGFRHTFTHFHLDITPVVLKVSEKPRISEPGLDHQGLFRWYQPDTDEIGLTGAVVRVMQQLHP